MNMRPLIYLACPYTDPDPRVRHRRFCAANHAAAMLMRAQDSPVFSPISHSHPIAQVLAESQTGEVGDWAYWEAFDKAILSVCRKLCVLPLPGWKESVGVQAEIAEATRQRIEVEILLDVFITEYPAGPCWFYGKATESK